jgi:5-methylcytosine-specific restriction protein A
VPPPAIGGWRLRASIERAWQERRQGKVYGGYSLMATKPQRYCTVRTCSEKVKAGRCQLHQRQQKQVYTRFQHGVTGYGRRWREKVRTPWLRAHPLCVQCEAEGRVTLANEVDHIIPHRGDAELMWNENNLQSLCRTHHATKTAREMWAR